MNADDARDRVTNLIITINGGGFKTNPHNMGIIVWSTVKDLREQGHTEQADRLNREWNLKQAQFYGRYQAETREKRERLKQERLASEEPREEFELSDEVKAEAMRMKAEIEERRRLYADPHFKSRVDYESRKEKRREKVRKDKLLRLLRGKVVWMPEQVTK